MNPDDAPNFSGNYPLGGERIGPAWRDMWRVLAGAQWVRSTAVTDAPSVTRHGLDPRTVSNLLRAARTAGVLEVRYRRGGKPSRRRAEYRVLAR